MCVNNAASIINRTIIIEYQFNYLTCNVFAILARSISMSDNVCFPMCFWSRVWQMIRVEWFRSCTLVTDGIASFTRKYTSAPISRVALSAVITCVSYNQEYSNWLQRMQALGSYTIFLTDYKQSSDCNICTEIIAFLLIG